MNGIISAEGYQKFVHSKWRNHIDEHQKQISIATHGLTGESGEVAELVKKKMADGLIYSKEKMVKELGDALFYITMLAELHESSLLDVMVRNIAKLQGREAAGTLIGNGSDR